MKVLKPIIRKSPVTGYFVCRGLGATGAGWTMRDAYSRWTIEMTLKGKTFPQ